MIAVIFEVYPVEGRKAHYLDHAARLRDELQWHGRVHFGHLQACTMPLAGQNKKTV